MKLTLWILLKYWYSDWYPVAIFHLLPFRQLNRSEHCNLSADFSIETIFLSLELEYQEMGISPCIKFQKSQDDGRQHMKALPVSGPYTTLRDITSERAVIPLIKIDSEYKRGRWKGSPVSNRYTVDEFQLLVLALSNRWQEMTTSKHKIHQFYFHWSRHLLRENRLRGEEMYAFILYMTPAKSDFW